MIGQIVRDVWVGGETGRTRRFSYGTRAARNKIFGFNIDTLALHKTEPERAVTCDMRQVPVAIGASGKYKNRNATGGAWQGHLPRSGPKESIERMADLQGVPQDFLATLREHGAFTAKAIQIGIGNGVPLAMGRAVARAVRVALADRD